MIDKLKIVAQTLKGIGQTNEGDLVHKAAVLLDQLNAVRTEAVKWKERAEAAEAELLRLKTAARKARP